jgi:uncharacterized membrane protein YtjA (UPF0391 family)
MLSLIGSLVVVLILAGIFGFWVTAGVAAAALQGLFWFVLGLLVMSWLAAVITGRPLWR